MSAKILTFDVETAPKLANVWGMWKQNIAPVMLENEGYVMTWAAKWLGEKKVMSDALINYDNKIENEGKLIDGLWELMDEADMIVTYNGNKFDIPVVNTAMIKAGMTPPAASKSIDLYLTVRRHFNFSSNKLDFVCEQLGLDRKVQHEGFELWRDCMQGKKTAWKTMLDYNKQDVVITEQLYEVVRPWIKNHPNVNIIDEYDTKVRCSACGSSDMKQNGYEYLTAGMYKRYRCNCCGANNRGRTLENTVAKRKSLTQVL